MKLFRYLMILIAAVALMAAPQGTKKPAAKGSTAADGSSKAAPKASLVDINSASEQDLKALPGIGDAYSAKIIAGRPYRAKNQLDQKKIIPHATYEKIKDMIIARQSAAPPSKKK